jgi:hypothetical protein
MLAEYLQVPSYMNLTVSVIRAVNWFADPYAARELLVSSDTNDGLPLDR